MRRSDKVQVGPISHWVEYNPPEQQKNGSWMTTGWGRLRFTHDDGTSIVLETQGKVAYGRTQNQAIDGVKARVNKVLDRVAAFINGDSPTKGKAETGAENE